MKDFVYSSLVIVGNNGGELDVPLLWNDHIFITINFFQLRNNTILTCKLSRNLSARILNQIKCNFIINTMTVLVSIFQH